MRYDVEFNSSVDYTAKGAVEAGIAAEKEGFDGVWEGEANNKDPIALVSALSTPTERVDLGTAILHPYSKTPTMVGQMAATVSDICDDRFILGLGAGTPAIASWHGKEMHDSPLTSMEEYIDITSQILDDGRADYDGEYYSADGFNMGVDPPKTYRIYVAALGPKMSRLAGRLGDGVIGNNTPPGHIAKVRTGARNGAKEAGKDPDDLDIVCKLRCSISDDVEAAREPLRKAATFYSLAPFYERMFGNLGYEDEITAIHDAYERDGFHAAKEEVTDEMLNGLPFVASTSTDEVEDRIEAYEEVGVTRMILAYVPNSNEPVEEAKQFLSDLDI